MAHRYRHPMFKGRHFDQEIILLCVRWYVTYKLSYRDLAAMMRERGISVAPSTIFRWVQRFEKRWDRFSRPVGCSWRVDETYISVKRQWCYLYRAVDKQGRTVDFLLREDRGIAAAQAFIRKAFSSHPNRPPRKVTLDGHWPSHRALRLLRREHPAWRGVHVRTCAYLNNVVEQDHRAIKARCGTMRGFKSFATAATTLAGIELAHRLRKRQALESTGVYWIPVYEVLERRGLTVWLVDARQLKYVPGRKSDVQDCKWLQKLMSLGLLRAAWRPGEEVCVVRAVARQREVLLSEQSSWVQRMHKALVQMNIQLAEVLTDVMGMTGQAIIRAIVAGERDPQVLARHRHRRIKASEADIVKALTGNWRDEHLFVLTQALAMYDSLAQRAAECDAKLEALLAPLGRHDIELAGPAKRAGKNTPGFDLRAALAR